MAAKKPTTHGRARTQSIQVANEIAAGRRHWVEHDANGKRVPLPRDATPLDVMLMAMRRAYELYGSLAAADYAEKAAPYVHAKIAPRELVPTGDVKRVEFVWDDEPTPQNRLEH